LNQKRYSSLKQVNSQKHLGVKNLLNKQQREATNATPYVVAEKDLMQQLPNFNNQIARKNKIAIINNS